MSRSNKTTSKGDIFKTKTGDLRVIEYVNAKEILVEFIDGKSSPFWAHIGNLRKGKYKNKYYPSVCNIGYIGEGASASENTEALYTWRRMLRRVYSTKERLRRPNTLDLKLQESWHNFQNFLIWYNLNYIEGFELDKDILRQGNNIYSEEMCCFLPREINTKYPKRYSISDKVYPTKDKNILQVTTTYLFNKRVTLRGKNRKLLKNIKELDTRLMLFRLVKKYKNISVKAKLALLSWRNP